METIILKAKKREELGRKVGALREQGLIPAVLYGHKVNNKNLTLTANEFTKVFQQAGTSTLIDLEIEGEKSVKVIIADLQRDPVQHNIIHTDFHQINMKEEITAEVALNFIGESPAVKEAGGVLLKSMEHINVKCLPSDLPHEFTVDVSELKEINSHFAVKDLEIPEPVQVLNDPEDVIATVKEVKVEVVEPVITAEEPVEGEEAEGEKDGEGEKKEGEEGTGEDDKTKGEKDGEGEKKK